ncbi:MAG TPA: DUF1499 domain-containing protein [Devosiaceae bacterium]|jgi:hypothetical protein|nr:DUF1499 domain-containing protein [Devosiaceae bacterium]
MRVLIRTSKWAIWARRLGSFALPLAVIPVFMHRAGDISTSEFEVIETLAIGLAALALVSSLAAFVHIWVSGQQGWWPAIAGLIFSLICLAPPAILLVDYLRYPPTHEMTTNAADPPPLLLSASPGEPATPAVLQAISLDFPNLRTRNYPLPADQLFAIVEQLVTERGWEVRERRAPADAHAEGQLNAIAMSLLGFRGEVSIRVRPEADGASLDMRSAALTPLYEPGDDAVRIEEFLTALDARVTELAKVQPAGSSDDDTDAEAQPDPTPVVPAPAPRARKH